MRYIFAECQNEFKYFQVSPPPGGYRKWRLKDYIGFEVISKSDLLTAQSIIEKSPIITKLDNKTKLYPSPFSGVPRFKVKEYYSENKIKAKNHYNFDLVNTLLIKNKEELNIRGYLSETHEYYVIPSKDFIKKYQPNFVTSFYSNAYDQVGYDAVEQCDFVLLDVRRTNELSEIKESYCLRTEGNKEINFLKGLASSNKTFKIIEDNIIQKSITKNSKIDDDIFESLKKLFASPDKSNYFMAKEILANSDITGSGEKYLYYIYNVYYDAFNRSKTNVNSKNLLSRIPKSWIRKKRSYDLLFSWDRFILDFNKLFPNNQYLIKPYILENLNRLLGDSIEDIKIKDLP